MSNPLTHPTSSALTGRAAIVTGGASGIGRATAHALCRHGASVAVVDIDEQGAASVVTELRSACSSDVIAVVADLSDPDAPARVVADALAAFGRVDILVNAAGITGDVASVLELAPPQWDVVFAVNTRAPYLMIQHVARHMVAAGHGGRIVNLASGSAFRAVNTPIAYGSSKAALVGLTRCVAAQLAPYDINVNAVAPGVTDTPMMAPYRDPDQGLQPLVTEGPLANMFARVSRPEDVAAVVTFLCLPESRQITAQTIHTSAGAIV
jgi:NAD(P)-dependent dehydrogenase (short-subunit alcohol dehydrogenase family)